MQKKIALSALLAFVITATCVAQMGNEDKSKRPSPPASASCDLGGGKTVKTDYSSPRMKGRKIYGGLVPFGEIWRTGANESTTFVTSSDISVGGTTVPAGSYTLFTVPKADSWSLVLSKKTGEWGTDYPGPSNDLARIPMKVSSLPSPLENFTINYAKSNIGCTLELDWDTTRASVSIAPITVGDRVRQ
jgi:hypothetical protein